MKKIALALILLAALGGVSLIPVGGTEQATKTTSNKVEPMDLSEYSKEKPDKKLELLFIHHSVGGQLFAEPGPDVGEHSIYQTHSNGGGLHKDLSEQGYNVHEASYTSEVGDKTDIFDWLPKFENDMEKVLTVANQNTYHTGGTRNQIVLFKSCYPNSDFKKEGESPGKTNERVLTVWNAKAIYKAVRDELEKQPNVLFVAFTAPPLVGRLLPEPLWKSAARLVLGKTRLKPSATGHLARKFNNWLVSKDGWLKDYSGKNIVVFDYYDILTANGKSDFAEYPSGGGADNHPSKTGNMITAKKFIPFLNRAVRRAGLAQ
ncbi:MAG: hypothetical protein GY847_36120 [Proteobacteria bacterium]|nr:hypothetical protein [Pseudomonadota bacterium]